MASDREQIDDLLTAYALALDVDDIEGCVQLFTAEGYFEVYGRRFEGWDGLRKMMSSAPRGMHFAGRAQIAVTGEQASVRSQLIFFEASLSETRLAIYDDVVVKIGDQWRFESRRCRFLTSGGLSDRPAKG